MGRFVKGDVVVIPFPFSDLSAAKRRPALVVALLKGDDVILCQITSKAVTDDYAIPIADADFTAGSLHQDSNVRPNRLFRGKQCHLVSCRQTVAVQGARSRGKDRSAHHYIGGRGQVK